MAKITVKGVLGIIGGVAVAIFAGVRMLNSKNEVDDANEPIETEDYEEVEAVEDEAE